MTEFLALAERMPPEPRSAKKVGEEDEASE